MPVLNEKALARLKDFLDADARDFCDDYNPSAPDPFGRILDWALDPEYGGLPTQAARPFANWISNVWADWVEEPIKVKDLLDGAVTDFCGGRVMPS